MVMRSRCSHLCGTCADLTVRHVQLGPRDGRLQGSASSNPNLIGAHGGKLIQRYVEPRFMENTRWICSQFWTWTSSVRRPLGFTKQALPIWFFLPLQWAA